MQKVVKIIVKDEVGNPYDDDGEILGTFSGEYMKNWQSLQLKAPGIPDGKHLAVLQWQYKFIDLDWLNCKGIYSKTECERGGIPLRQIYVLATSPNKQLEEAAKDYGKDNHLYNCPFCNGSERDSKVLLGYKYPKFRVSCVSCGFNIEDDRVDKVKELWNTRDGKGWLQSNLEGATRQSAFQCSNKDFCDFVKQGAEEDSQRVVELEGALNAFVNSCYTGCTKDELNQLRINAEKILKS